MKLSLSKIPANYNHTCKLWRQVQEQVAESQRIKLTKVCRRIVSNQVWSEVNFNIIHDTHIKMK